MKMTAKEPSARFQCWDEVLAEVVRLERQMRQQAAAATQPTAVADAALAERAPAADLKQDDALAGNGRNCRYCGKPVQLQALYCGFCGKPVAVSSQKPVGGREQNAARLKPMRAKSPANGKPAAVSPVNASPVVATPPHSVAGHKPSSWRGIFRMTVSLCLLAFLVYYTYQKVKYNRDVIVPIRAAIIRGARPVLAKSRLYIDKGLQECAELIGTQ